MSGKNAVHGLKLSIISITILLASSAAMVFLTADPLTSAAMAIAAILFMACLAIMFMALRKFGNEEMDAGSRLVKTANSFGFAAFAALLLALDYRLYQLNWAYAAVVLLLAAVVAFKVARIGKESMKYW